MIRRKWPKLECVGFMNSAIFKYSIFPLLLLSVLLPWVFKFVVLESKSLAIQFFISGGISLCDKLLNFLFLRVLWAWLVCILDKLLNLSNVKTAIFCISARLSAFRLKSWEKLIYNMSISVFNHVFYTLRMSEPVS